MREIQEHIMAELGVQPVIDPAVEVERRVTFLAHYARASQAQGLLLGISGGVDSTLAGRLGQLAAERLRAEGYLAHFMAVHLPYHAQIDEPDVQAALDFIRPDQRWTFPIASGVESVVREYHKVTGNALSDFNKGNVKARLRMTAQYALAGEHRFLVLGTDHAAESVTGFFTKFGDGGADLLPLANLNKRQNRALLGFLGASERLCHKTPTADLLDTAPGRPDEDELGLRYDDIDDYLEGKAVPSAVAEKIEMRYLKTRHKRTLPITPHDTWWSK